MLNLSDTLIFNSLQEIRKVVQSLEQTAREILTLLQGVHQGAGFQDSKFFALILKVFFFYRVYRSFI